MTKQKTKKDQTQAAKQIKAHMAQVESLVKQSEMLADEFGLSFSMNISYGMGGRYYPNPARCHEWPGKPEDYEDFIEYEDGTARHTNYSYADNDEGLWYSSSMSC